MKVLQCVVIPSSIPSIISILKVNIGLCLVGVIRARLPDHLCKSDFQAELSNHSADYPLYYRLWTLSGHPEAGASYKEDTPSVKIRLQVPVTADYAVTALQTASAITSAARVPATLISASISPMDAP